MKRYRAWDPRQSFLMPPSPTDWLPDGHLVYFLLDVLVGLDLCEIEAVIHIKDARGTRPYDPRMMTGLLLYGYCVGVTSSRKLERATVEDVAFRVLMAGNQPDHTAISEFRRRHLRALSGLFLQVLRLCQGAGLVKLGHVALDGTKVEANASKHKAMSYERMLKTEKQLAEEIEELLQRAEQTDAEEDARYGKSKRGDELPEELQRRESRQRKIREARQALEAEAAKTRALEKKEQAERARRRAEQVDTDDGGKAERRAQRAAQQAESRAQQALEQAEGRVEEASRTAQQQRETASTTQERRQARTAERRVAEAERDRDEVSRALSGEDVVGGTPAFPAHRVQATAHGEPTAKAQRNFTDPDSRIMKQGTDFVQGFNCQAAVDEGHQVIVAQGVTNQAPDQQHLPAMLHQVVTHCGRPPKVFTADAGYWSEENADVCEDSGTDAYIATGRLRRGRSEEDDPVGPEASPQKERMGAKLRTKTGKAAYARRKAVVEPVFGQIKQARGIRRLWLRGLESVRAEWSLICTGHNLLKLFRAAMA